MILPRLIIADEVREGRVPASLILIQAMRNRQIPVNVFFCGRTEEDIRIMKLLTNDAPVCSIDAYTMFSPRNIKLLFEQCSSEKGISVVSMPLGEKLDDKTFQVYPTGIELSKILDCDIIPIVSASTQAVSSASVAFSALSAIDELAPNRAPSILFSSIKNPRDFQILEREFSRRSAAYVLGYMPESADCAMPSFEAVSHKNPLMNLIQVKSAALQLGGQMRQVDWQVMDALSVLDREWSSPVPLTYPKKLYNVAVFGQSASLEGDSNLEVFKAMGCKLYFYNHQNDKFPAHAEVFYFPHTLTAPYLEELLNNTNFRIGIIASIRANKKILAMGSASLLFGSVYLTADQHKINGLRVFPYGGTISGEDYDDRIRRIEARCMWTTCFFATDEKVRGYTAGGFSIANPGNLAPSCLSYRDVASDREIGVSSWTIGNCFVTDLKLDLWSALDAVNHWLLQP